MIGDVQNATPHLPLVVAAEVVLSPLPVVDLGLPDAYLQVGSCKHYNSCMSPKLAFLLQQAHGLVDHPWFLILLHLVDP